jgi:hypothetical protein
VDRLLASNGEADTRNGSGRCAGFLPRDMQIYAVVCAVSRMTVGMLVT